MDANNVAFEKSLFFPASTKAEEISFLHTEDAIEDTVSLYLNLLFTLVMFIGTGPQISTAVPCGVKW